MAIKNGKWVFPKYSELTPAVKRFFEILDSRETSNNDVEFNPVKMDYEDLRISSCRVFLSAELADLLPQMKLLVDSKKKEADNVHDPASTEAEPSSQTVTN